MRRAWRIRAVIIVIVIVAIATGRMIIYKHDGTSKTTKTTSQANNANTQPQESPKPTITPGYNTILPQGKSIASLGGWALVSPPRQSPVYAYVDAIKSVSINVTEQPLPASFGDNTSDSVQSLANSYHATTTIAAGKTTVYIGTSSKGPQSIIFTKDNLLILIKSDNVIPDSDWIKYVKSLQ